MSATKQRLCLLGAITSLVAEAADSGRVLITGKVVTDLSARYPGSGMSSRAIERELIREVGLARGVVMIDGTKHQSGELEGGSPLRMLS